ncbi:MAG TPA: gliding motility-associated C-terminal domain-containing protein, partial [Ferruginibacter sp.]|nr:gliding motility-associated C-terminal domain-containing protein [Ferruginibacter sp.]
DYSAVPPVPGNDAVSMGGIDTLHYSDSTIYRVILSSLANANCSDTAQVTVIVARKLIIPNIISPNAEGQYTTWHIGNIEQYPQARVSIFNRYGQFVFESPEGYPIPWDGTDHGQPLAVGTYFYIIETTPGASPYSGPISIVR